MSILSYFRRKKLPKREWSFPQIDIFDVPNDVRVYLIGFSYDPPTTQLLTWLREILSSRKVDQSKVFRFNDNRQTKQDLATLLEDGRKRVELFCGHGASTGLFGPPHREVTGSILSDLSSIIYDTEMIAETPGAMFAFCCQAAENFGRIFSSYKEKQFMGFKDDIPFPVELYEDLKYVFHTVAKDIIQQGEIQDRHRDLFIAKLDEIAAQPVDYQNHALIQLWLDEYKKHLMLFA